MRSKTGQSGFTAVEVMVSTLIVGLILAAGIPSFRGLMQSNNLQSGADEFAGRLRLARQAAVAEGLPYILAWDSHTQTYSIGRDENEDDQLQSAEIQSGPYTIAGGLTLSNASSGGFGASQVIFSPDGSASETGTVVLENCNAVSVELTVLAPTGQVRID